VRDTFSYCLALAMVEAGKARLVETRPGEAGKICVFESSVGERFSVVVPKMNKESKAALIDTLREMLEDEGQL
jgi:hypothetical protein